jgi:hypothetical protein
VIPKLSLEDEKVVIAICAAYAAPDLAGRTAAASGRIRVARLAGGATPDGLGDLVDALHGSWPFSLPVPASYVLNWARSRLRVSMSRQQGGSRRVTVVITFSIMVLFQGLRS